MLWEFASALVNIFKNTCFIFKRIFNFANSINLPFNMKFTKEDARKELSTRIVTNGETLSLSERSINDQIETLMALLANEETELADFIEKVVPIFKTTNANIRNDVSAGIKDYQEKNPPTKKEPKTEKEEKKEGVESEIEKRLKMLEDELNTAKAEKRVSEVKRNVVAKLKEKGVKDETWISDFLSEITIGDDFDVDAKVASYVKLYNKKEATTPPDVTPGSASGGGVNKQLNDTIKEAGAIAKGMRLEPESK